MTLDSAIDDGDSDAVAVEAEYIAGHIGADGAPAKIRIALVGVGIVRAPPSGSDDAGSSAVVGGENGMVRRYEFDVGISGQRFELLARNRVEPPVHDPQIAFMLLS